MKTIISARDVEELLRHGGDLKSLPVDAILTPSARDLLRETEHNGARRDSATTDRACTTAPESMASLYSNESTSASQLASMTFSDTPTVPQTASRS